jgi:hypothetical protein
MSEWKEPYFDEQYTVEHGGDGDGDRVIIGGPSGSYKSGGVGENIWATLFSLSWKQTIPGITREPKYGKMLTYDGKILKNVEAVYVFDFFTDSGHSDCIVRQFEVNNKKFNPEQSQEDLAEFFVNGIGKDSPLTLYIALKWQGGHWPPEVNTANIKIVERTFNEQRSLQNYMLKKEFRNVIAMNIKNQKVIFSKA